MGKVISLFRLKLGEKELICKDAGDGPHCLDSLIVGI